MSFATISAVFVTCLASLASSMAEAGTTEPASTTWTVCETGCDYSDLQDAINVANDGDVIQIASGFQAVGTTNYTNGKAVTIQGETDVDGSLLTTVYTSGNTWLYINNGEGPGTIVKDLILVRGTTAFVTTRGGGIQIGLNASPIIENIDFVGLRAVNKGGGIHCQGCLATIRDCSFIDNETDGFGGGISVFDVTANPIIENCTFRGNQAQISGGAIDIAANVDAFAYISGTTICGNSTPQISGEIFDAGGNSFLELCDLDGDHDGDTIVNDCDPDFPLSIPDSRVQVLAGDGAG